MKIIATFLLSILIISQSYSRERLYDTTKTLTRPSRFGISGAYNMNSHTTDFRKFEGIPNCCPKFESGDGSGFTFGAFYDMFFSKMIGLQLRGDYSTKDGLLETVETTTLGLQGEKVNSEFVHSVDVKLASIGFNPLLDLRLGDFSISVGPRVGYYFTQDYHQKETVADERAVFLDNLSTTRNDSAGVIPNGEMTSLELVAGLRFEFPLTPSRSVLIAPEVFYNYGLTEVVSDFPWKVNTIRAGVSVIFSPPREETFEIDSSFAPRKPIQEEEIEIAGNTSDIIYGVYKAAPDEIIVEQPKLEATIKAFGVNEGLEFPNATLKVEEFLSTNMRPLLNYVFFDENSSSLPERYRKISTAEASDFSIAKLHNLGTLDTYYDMLNIIGKRLRDSADATITITGTNSNSGSEQNATALSQARAQTVFKYLRDVWDIAPERMSVQARNLPEKPSNTSDPDGIEENRRVEIASDSWAIMKPVVTNDTLVKTDPPIIRFYPEVDAERNIKSWEVAALQNREPLKEFSGDNAPPEKIDWVLSEDRAAIPAFSDPLMHVLSVEDAAGGRDVGKGVLPLEQITIQRKRQEKRADKRIDKFALILFEFGQSTLTPANQRIVDFIKSNIETYSNVEITGYTDRMGDADGNLQLSAARAQRLKDLLSPEAFQRGLGETKLLYDNDLPEGRFYSRTVVVDVETPIKW